MFILDLEQRGTRMKDPALTDVGPDRVGGADMRLMQMQRPR